MKKIFVALSALALVSAYPAHAENLTNDDVITLASMGLGDEAIIAKIKASSNTFKVTTEDMIALKNKGVSGPIIAAMLAATQNSGVSASAQASSDSPDPMVPHPSGIYILKNWDADPKMARIDPTTSNQTKSGGMLGYALTGGIASLSMKTVLPNAGARTRSPNGAPVFYFYFDQASQSLSNGASGNIWGIGPGAAVTSPNEFSLVRFNVKKNGREAKVGSFNIGGAKSGVMDKDRINFSYEEVRPGVFKVFPDATLEPGEYGFLYSMSTGSGPGMFSGGAQSARIFDFAVEGVPTKKK
jgi:hypothetical protein